MLPFCQWGPELLSVCLDLFNVYKLCSHKQYCFFNGFGTDQHGVVLCPVPSRPIVTFLKEKKACPWVCKLFRHAECCPVFSTCWLKDLRISCHTADVQRVFGVNTCSTEFLVVMLSVFFALSNTSLSNMVVLGGGPFLDFNGLLCCTACFGRNGQSGWAC